MIPVVWWSNHDEVDPAIQWDSGLLHLLFDGFLGPLAHTFNHMTYIPPNETAIVVVAGRHHSSDEDAAALNEAISHLEGVLLIVIGDEESTFPWRDIKHDNIRWWVMHPHPIKHGDMVPWAYFFGTGFRRDTPLALTDDLHVMEVPSVSEFWSFSGQVTHPRRRECVQGLRKVMAKVPGQLTQTPGFTQGLDRNQYLRQLRSSRVCPAPSGPCTPDTFRLYEALEAGAYPMVDNGPDNYPAGYWEMVYGPDHPLFVVHDWETFGPQLEIEATRWPVNANVTSAWWQQTKRGMVRRLTEDLNYLRGAFDDPLAYITGLITTSPIPSHPDMGLLVETMESFRHHCPDAPLIIACDGVRPEQEHLRDAYNEYVRRICWLANHEWDNVVPVVMSRHVHQANTTREALKQVFTPTLLFMEHDTPLIVDHDIPIEAIIDLIDYGSLDVVRLYHEAVLQQQHKHLMRDWQPVEMAGVPLVRTVQFSARPHVASVDYYRDIIGVHFPIEGSAFIEDKMHSVAQVNPAAHRIAIFHPEGDIKRSTHTDGRAGGPKFSEAQQF